MWCCIHRLEVFPLLKLCSRPKCFPYKLRCWTQKDTWDWLSVPFFRRAMLYVCSVNWRVGAARLGTSGGFDLKLSYLWNILFSACDCHLLRKQLFQVTQLVTPLSPAGTGLLRSLLCASTNQSVTAAELFPPTLPAPAWQWCLHPGKGPEGWLKTRMTFLFLTCQNLSFLLFSNIISHTHFNEK